MSDGSRIIELVLKVDPERPFDPVVPSEQTGPTCIQITPYVEDGHSDEPGRLVKFRVAFEPQNRERRRQPYRENIEPIFPNGWQIGDEWTAK